MIKSEQNTPPLNKPQQKRSAKTLERIIAAAIRLLADREYQDISMVEIAREAGISVGTIYTRFADKDALLTYLIVELQNNQLDAAGEMFDPDFWQGVPLAQRIRQWVDLMVHSSERNPGILRAIAIRQLFRRGELSEIEIANRNETLSLIEFWLLECRDEIKNADPEKAVRFTLSLMTHGVQANLLFSRDHWGVGPADLKNELARAAIAYLTAETELPDLDERIKPWSPEYKTIRQAEASPKKTRQ